MFEYATVTDKGGRKINEDSIGVFENGENFGCVLCDGLGGHGMGDVASCLVRDVFANLFEKRYKLCDFLDETFNAAQEILLTEQEKRKAKRKMKTTAVAMVSDEKNIYIGHIGDSRLYYFSKGKLKKRTLDHSVPQMLALSKDIKESEIRFHHDRNIVLRVMGTDWEDESFDLMKPLSIKKADAFLLCSDGFWELIDEKKMCEFLKAATSVKEWLDNMTQEVIKNGADKNMDNYSAIAVWHRKG